MEGKRLLCTICLLVLACVGGDLVLGLGEESSGKMKTKIYLVPVGDIEGWVLESLGRRLEDTFKCEVEVDESIKLPQEAYHQKRGQYLSTRILERLSHSMKVGEQDKVLGIADVDLYAGGLNFVFGEAELGGHFAVISLVRLRQSFYGLPEDKNLFLERSIKEAVHEIGHLYGLRHCPDADCVMHFSNSLQDTDRKRTSFCPRCKDLPVDRPTS